MAGPFKMKGSPMQRNFGIGSPLHDNEKKEKTTDKPEIKTSKGTTIFGNTPKEFIKKAAKPYTESYKLLKKTAKTFLVDAPKDYFNIGK